jgi:hypothetical protein
MPSQSRVTGPHFCLSPTTLFPQAMIGKISTYWQQVCIHLCFGRLSNETLNLLCIIACTISFLACKQEATAQGRRLGSFSSVCLALSASSACCSSGPESAVALVIVCTVEAVSYFPGTAERRAVYVWVSRCVVELQQRVLKYISDSQSMIPCRPMGGVSTSKVGMLPDPC